MQLCTRTVVEATNTTIELNQIVCLTNVNNVMLSACTRELQPSFVKFVLDSGGQISLYENGATFDGCNTGFVRIKSCVTCIIVCIDDPPSSFTLQWCANGCQLPTHSQHARLAAFESCFAVGSYRAMISPELSFVVKCSLSVHRFRMFSLRGFVCATQSSCMPKKL